MEQKARFFSLKKKKASEAGSDILLRDINEKRISEKDLPHLEKMLNSDRLLLAQVVNNMSIMAFLDEKGSLLRIAKDTTTCALINNSRYIHEHPASFIEVENNKQRRR